VRPAPRWLAALVGLAVGLLLGLTYAWIIDPVRPLNAYPALLRSDYRAEWMRVATSSYLSSGDLERLRARLSGLADADVRQGLAIAIESVPQAVPGVQEVDRRRILAEAFNLPLPSALEAAPTPDARELTTASPTFSSSAFRVAQRSSVCRPQPTPSIEVIVRDPNGSGMPGVRLWLVWHDGADWAVTGLRPARSPGYADFDARTGVPYALGLGEYGMPLLFGLTVPTCTVGADGQSRASSYRIDVQLRPEEDLVH
jgi:hypothetical protein